MRSSWQPSALFRIIVFVVTWAITSTVLFVLFGWPWLADILVGVVLTGFGILVLEINWDDVWS